MLRSKEVDKKGEDEEKKRQKRYIYIQHLLTITTTSRGKKTETGTCRINKHPDRQIDEQKENK